MRIFIGSDHGGFTQKEQLLKKLESLDYSVTDCGTYSAASTDYPDFALAVAQSVAKNPDARGILLCRSGEGMEIAANKVPKIRAALVWNSQVAAETRKDNDANILVLPSDYLSNSQAEEIATIFLTTNFSGEERHVRRLEKLANIERGNYEG